VEGTSQWFQGRKLIPSKKFAPKYHRLLAQQNGIGWRQIFNGRMTTEWARLQDDYYYNARQRKHEEAAGNQVLVPGASRHARSGTSWTSEIIVSLWDQWYKVWTLRNANIHGHDKATRAKHQIEVDQRRLQTIYQNRQHLEPSIQDLLFATAEDHQRECSPLAIRNWLSINETIILQSIKNAKTRAIQGVRSIKTYFRAANKTAKPMTRQSPRTPISQRSLQQPRKNSILSYFATGRPPGKTHSTPSLQQLNNDEQDDQPNTLSNQK
jgi:hypothetical protein